MRKFFALALAVAMVMSLAAVSFAADCTYDEFDFNEGTIVLSPFFKYSSDSDKVSATQAEYGKSYYAMIFEGNFALGVTGANEDVVDENDTVVLDFAAISDYDQVEKLKVKAEFEMGEDLVESVSIVKKAFKTAAVKIASTGADTDDITKSLDNDGALKVTYKATENAGGDLEWQEQAAAAITAPTAGKYYYFVEIKTKADRVVGDADIIGTLEFNRKAKDDVTKIDGVEIDFATNLWYEKNYNGGDDYNTSLTVEDEVNLKWDDKYVLKFESDDEVTFNFGTDPNEGEFTVDASGQGKMVIDFNTKANEAIWAANEGVDMFFVNFNGAKFNRTGTFEYEMEDMVAAYQVVDDKLVEINGLELDGETATFSTRTLGNYVFATAELVNPVAEAPVVEAPAAVTNPSTGF